MQSFENVHYGFDCAKQFPYTKLEFKCNNNNKKNNIKSNRFKNWKQEIKDGKSGNGEGEKCESE